MLATSVTQTGLLWNHRAFKAGRRVWVWLNRSVWPQSTLTSIQRDCKTKAMADVYRSPKKTFKGREGRQEIISVTGIPQ